MDHRSKTETVKERVARIVEERRLAKQAGIPYVASITDRGECRPPFETEPRLWDTGNASDEGQATSQSGNDSEEADCETLKATFPSGGVHRARTLERKSSSSRPGFARLSSFSWSNVEAGPSHRAPTPPTPHSSGHTVLDPHDPHEDALEFPLLDNAIRRARPETIGDILYNFCKKYPNIRSSTEAALLRSRPRSASPNLSQQLTARSTTESAPSLELLSTESGTKRKREQDGIAEVSPAVPQQKLPKLNHQDLSLPSIRPQQANDVRDDELDPIVAAPVGDDYGSYSMPVDAGIAKSGALKEPTTWQGGVTRYHPPSGAPTGPRSQRSGSFVSPVKPNFGRELSVEKSQSPNLAEGSPINGLLDNRPREPAVGTNNADRGPEPIIRANIPISVDLPRAISPLDKHRRQIYTANGWQSLLVETNSSNFQEATRIRKKGKLQRLVEIRCGEHLYERDLVWNSRFLACLIYERGHIKDQPCSYCAGERGSRPIFERCVVLAGESGDCCASCKFAERDIECSHNFSNRVRRQRNSPKGARTRSSSAHDTVGIDSFKIRGASDRQRH